MGLPNNVDRDELENTVVKTSQVAGINIRRQNFQAVHRLTDQCIVIAKFTNRCDTIDILKQKKKLQTLGAEDEHYHCANHYFQIFHC